MIFFGHVFVNADPGQAFEDYGGAKELVGRSTSASDCSSRSRLLRRAAVRALVHPRHETPLGPPLRAQPRPADRAGVLRRRRDRAAALRPRRRDQSDAGQPVGHRPALGVVAGALGLHLHAELHRRLRDAALRPGVVAGRRGRLLFLLPLAAAFAYRLGGRITTATRAKAALAALGAIGLVSIYLRQGSDDFAVLTSPPFILYAFVPGSCSPPPSRCSRRACARTRAKAKRLAYALGAVTVLAWALYAHWDYAVETTALHHALGRRALMAAICAAPRSPRSSSGSSAPTAPRAGSTTAPSSTSARAPTRSTSSTSWSCSRSSTSSAPTPTPPPSSSR